MSDIVYALIGMVLLAWISGGDPSVYQSSQDAAVRYLQKAAR